MGIYTVYRKWEYAKHVKWYNDVCIYIVTYAKEFNECLPFDTKKLLSKRTIYLFLFKIVFKHPTAKYVC